MLARRAEKAQGFWSALSNVRRAAPFSGRNVLRMWWRRVDLSPNCTALPFIAKQLLEWIENPARQHVTIPAIRCDFLTRADARVILAARPEWTVRLRGDLQMHTRWSDGSGSILEMAQAAKERHYESISITDHSKGLKIAGGIDEAALAEQAVEIAEANEALRGSKVTVCARSK
jgi:hypothetical protein